jgi:hypothetical protein
MPQAIPVIAQVVAAATASAIGYIATAAVLTYAAKSLFKSGGRGAPPINVTIRSTIAPRTIVLGRVRVGGAILYVNTSGNKNKYLWYVVAYAGHQCNDAQDAWLDKVRIPNANINSSTGVVTDPVGVGLDDKLRIWTHLGTGAQTVDATLDAEFTEWTSNHRLRGITYRVFRFERSDKAWPNGSPQNCSSLIEGALTYDPRLDSTNGGSGTHRRDNPSTWSFSRNWARNLRWYLSGGSVVNDQSIRLIRYGVREPDSRIDDAYVIAAANVSDQSLSGANAPPTGAQERYTLDLEISCTQTRRDALEEILAVGGPGQLANIHGKWRMYAATYDAPSHTFTQQNLFGELQVQDTSGPEERFNQLAAVYVDAARDYTEQTSQMRSDAAYVTQDASEERPKEIILRGCTDEYRAQRLVELFLRSARQMRTLRIPFGREGMAVAPWETFSFSYARYGWTARTLRCTKARELERTSTGGLICWITARAEPASVHTDLVTADYLSGTSVTNALQSEPPDAPTSLTATTGNGYIEFNWALPEFWRQHGTVELWEHTAITPFSSATKIWEGRGTRVVIPKIDTTTRYYWVRVAAGGGQTSDTEPATNGVAGTAYNAVIATPVTATPADGNIAYTAGTQPRVETSGIGSHISYTSPAGFATRCGVAYSAQANVSNTTSGVAVGFASLQVLVQVNGSTVFSRDLRLEALISTADAWGNLAGEKVFDVPAGQTIDVFLNVGRTFSTGGSSPAQTINWRAAHIEIWPTKK